MHENKVWLESVNENFSKLSWENADQMEYASFVTIVAFVVHLDWYKFQHMGSTIKPEEKLSWWWTSCNGKQWSISKYPKALNTC